MGVGVSDFLGKRYEDVRFNVIGVMRGWVGVQFPEKKRYVTLEWPLIRIRAVYLVHIIHNMLLTCFH